MRAIMAAITLLALTSFGYASEGRIVSHPAGCPHTEFCGCGVSVFLYGHPVRSLFEAQAFRRFPHAAPGYKMVAWKAHHAFVILAVHGHGRVLAYDPNSGHHKTRIHERSLRGFHVVNPFATVMAGL